MAKMSMLAETSQDRGSWLEEMKRISENNLIPNGFIMVLSSIQLLQLCPENQPIFKCVGEAQIMRNMIRTPTSVETFNSLMQLFSNTESLFKNAKASVMTEIFLFAIRSFKTFFLFKGGKKEEALIQAETVFQDIEKIRNFERYPLSFFIGLTIYVLGMNNHPFYPSGIQIIRKIGQLYRKASNIEKIIQEEIELSNRNLNMSDNSQDLTFSFEFFHQEELIPEILPLLETIEEEDLSWF